MTVQYHCLVRNHYNMIYHCVIFPHWLHCLISIGICFKTCPGSTNVAEHFISTTGTPVKVPPHQIPANYRSKVESQIQMMLEEGVIEECSNS